MATATSELVAELARLRPDTRNLSVRTYRRLLSAWAELEFTFLDPQVARELGIVA